MITAAELHKIGIKARATRIEEDVAEAHKIMEEIIGPRLRSAAESGDVEYTCSWPGWSDTVWFTIKNTLEREELGYIVNRHRETGETLFYISWAHAGKRR